MQDLFGASSSDDEKAPAGSTLASTRNPGGNEAEGNGDVSAQGTPSVAGSGLPVLKVEGPAGSQGSAQAAGSNAVGAKLPGSAPEQRSNKDAEMRTSSRPASARKVGVAAGSSGTGAGDVAEGRIDYARVAERLRQKASGREGNRHTGKGSAKKRKKPFDPWEPIMESEGPARTGSIGRDAAAKGGSTPRRMEPWGAAASDEDASAGSQDDSSAASDSTKHRSRAAALRRGGSTKRKALQPAGSAKLEPKKATIPEALKQTLAAQVPFIPIPVPPTTARKPVLPVVCNGIARGRSLQCPPAYPASALKSHLQQEAGRTGMITDSLCRCMHALCWACLGSEQGVMMPCRHPLCPRARTWHTGTARTRRW